MIAVLTFLGWWFVIACLLGPILGRWIKHCADTQSVVATPAETGAAAANPTPAAGAFVSEIAA